MRRSYSRQARCSAQRCLGDGDRGRQPRARSRGPATAAPGLQRQPGRERQLGLRRELRELSYGRPCRTQRGAAARRQQLHEHLAQQIHQGFVRVHPVDDAADRREPQRGAIPCRHRVHPAGQRRARRRSGADGDDRGADRQHGDRRDPDRCRGRGAAGRTRRGARRTSGRARPQPVRRRAADAAARLRTRDRSASPSPAR